MSSASAPRPRKFFVVGGYAHSNPGDEAILKATLVRLNRLLPGSHFVIWYDEQGFTVRFAPGISYEFFFYPYLSFFSKKGWLSGKSLGLYRRLFPFSQKLVRFFLKRGELAVKKMREADMIIFVGGGYLNSQNDLPQMHYLYSLARESRRPIYLLGQTIGPFSRKKDREIAKAICAGAEKIVLREEGSRSELLTFKDKVIVGADDALDFQNDLSPGGDTCGKYLERTDGTQVLLGLNLRHAEKPVNYYAGLVESLNRFNLECAKGKLKVVFIPMETSIYCDDRDEAEKLGQVPGRNFEYAVMSDPLTVEDRLEAISKTDIFVGMRFHSLVFAVSSAVPCLGLYQGDYYLRKIGGLMDPCGTGPCYISLDRISETSAQLASLYHNRVKIQTCLRQKHADMLKKQGEIFKVLFGEPSIESLRAAGPKISVIIPSYNQERFIARAVESAMAQEYPAYEIIVVDDGSEDDTPNILKRYEGMIITKRIPHSGGPAEPRNAGIRMATGDYLAFLDADDFWYANKLKTEVETILKYPQIGLFCCDFDLSMPNGSVNEIQNHFGKLPFIDDLNFGAPMKRSPFLQLFLSGNFTGTASAITVKKSLIEEVGFFNPAYNMAEDYDFCLRCATKTNFVLIQKILFQKTQHELNLSNDIVGLFLANQKVLEHTFKAERDYIRMNGIESLCRLLVAKAYYKLGNSYYEWGQPKMAFSRYLQGLRSCRHPLNLVLFTWVTCKKIARTLSFNLLTREKILKRKR